MFYISEIMSLAPAHFTNELQEQVYEALEQLKIWFERVETDEAITMEDCVLINEKLNMDMVKTLFLCNSKKTMFYLFVTAGDKQFDTRRFCSLLGISRVSFAPKELFDEILRTRIGAATVFSALMDRDKDIQVIFDKDVTDSEYYGCSDGTTTGYMKIKTNDVLNVLLPYCKHKYKVIDF